MTRKHLSRRTFLRGAGTAMALPVLDAMTPAFAKPARTTSNASTRMAFVYVPNGIIMKDWTPAAKGTDFELPAILEPLKAHRQSMVLFSGLTQNGGRALGYDRFFGVAEVGEALMDSRDQRRHLIDTNLVPAHVSGIRTEPLSIKSANDIA